MAQPSSYQEVFENEDWVGMGGGVHYLNFDGTDDLISTTLPAIENGTLVIAGTNGIWIDDDYNFEGGAFSVGPGTYTGGPAGLMSILGDILVEGVIVIDRQLTETERQQIKDYFVQKGAPGVFELGPELNSNSGPGFQTTDGWISLGSADLYVEDGELRAKNTDLLFGRARSIITGIEPGQSYLASFSTRGVVGTPSTNLGYGNDQTGYLRFTTTPVTTSTVITAVSGEDNIMFNLQNGNGSVENEGAVIYYSLRKLELVP